jgi:hypothetical protein
LTSPSAHVFPPPFDGRKPGGGTTRINDVDELLALAADHAGVPAKRLDRRRLEESLHMIGAPDLHAERAVMVFTGRARQARRIAMRRSVRRMKAFAWIVVSGVLLAVYGVRLHARLDAKLTRVRDAGVVLARARTDYEAVNAALSEARDRQGPGGVSRLDAVDDRVALARRRYDDRANDYDASVRGFPTAPFVRLVGLPPRVPMSWEPGAPGESRLRGRRELR